MGNTASNVTAGKPKVAGSIFCGATGLTMPTDAVSAIPTGFTALGYAADAGLTNQNSRSSEAIKAWGGDTVLSIQTEKTDTFTVTLIEAKNPDVQKVVNGDSNVTGSISDGIVVKVNAKELDYHAWIFDMVIRGGVMRIVIPNGKVTEIGEITYVDNEAIAYPITISAEPDTEGNSHYEYIKEVA